MTEGQMVESVMVGMAAYYSRFSPPQAAYIMAPKAPTTTL